MFSKEDLRTGQFAVAVKLLRHRDGLEQEAVWFYSLVNAAMRDTP